MKLNKADRIKRTRVPVADPALADRLPPGHVLTERFPVLHEGEVPEYNMDDWTLKIYGRVEQEVTLSYNDILELPQTTVQRDIHCVTRWSRFDNSFTGVKFQDLMKALGVTPNSQYIMLHGDYDYTTNVALSDLDREDVLLAHSLDGEPLTAKHGYPLRFVVPHLYFWKSV